MKLRLLSYIVATLLVVGPAQAQSQLLLGAGKPTVAAGGCVAFMPAAFNSSALYINWTTADGLGGFGMACLNGTTPVAASTLGTISGSGSVGASGLVLTGGFFQFSNVTWLTQNSGTVYSNAALTSISGGHTIFDISDGSLINAIRLRAVNAAINGVTILAGVSTATTSGFSATVNAPFKIGYSYTAGTQIVYINGATTAATSAASNPPTLNASNIGATGTGTIVFAGTHTEEAYFSTALNAGTTPTLQAITQ